MELFERNAVAAWGVAYAVVRNRDDANDAVADAYAKVLRAGSSVAPREFRAYFLRVVHNAAVDIQRRAQRVEPGDVEDQADFSEPADAVLAEEDRAIVAGAFAELPERWRSALWLIDVEELSTKEAGAVLGVSATNAAQLATRARSRLREHYFQAHVPNHVRPGCGDTVEALGRYAAGSLSPRRRIALERHIAGCAECAARLAELDDLGMKLRRALPPMPLALGLGWGRRRPGGGEGPIRSLLNLFAAQGGSVMSQAAAASPVIERLAAGATATVLAVGISTLAVRSGDQHHTERPGGQPSAHEAAARETGPLAGAGGRGPQAVTPAAVLGGSGPLVAALTPGVTPGTPSVAASAAPALERPLLVPAGADLRGVDLRGLDLRGVDLAGQNLTGANLAGANLAGANLNGANLNGANLSGVDLSGARLANADLGGANLQEARLTGADLAGVDLRTLDLRGADLSGALGLPPLGPTPSPSLGLPPLGPAPSPSLDLLTGPKPATTSLVPALPAVVGQSPLGGLSTPGVLLSPLPQSLAPGALADAPASAPLPLEPPANAGGNLIGGLSPGLPAPAPTALPPLPTALPTGPVAAPVAGPEAGPIVAPISGAVSGILPASTPLALIPAPLGAAP